MSDATGLVDFIRDTLQIPRFWAEFKRIDKRLQAVEEKIDLRAAWYDRADCARLRNVTKSYFDKYPHLLPRFGVPDDTIPKRMWSLETVRAWLKTPLSKLERRWQKMSDRQRATICEMRRAA